MKSDHLPLKRFPNKTALNAKVNNWGAKLSDFNIRLKFIKSVKNGLVDALCRLSNLE